NEHSATLTGVPVPRIKVIVYMISSLSAGVAGIIQTGWLGAVTTNIGAGMELQVIAANGKDIAAELGPAQHETGNECQHEHVKNWIGDAEKPG
ncbi:ABC transporter permease subunit, partial [Rhizobium leguminosarum]|uniref:ABC transporter permease subunit n=1 Tax=Rhizobium leguminosarum TaxID=384 RepID=UPI003F9EA7E7